MFLFRNDHPALIALLTAALTLPAAVAEAGPFNKRKKHEKRQQKAEEILAENYVPSDAWEAYFRDEKGRTFELIQPVERNKDRDWMGLLFTGYSGPKLRLAVMEVQNNINNQQTAGLQALLFGQQTQEIPIGSIEELMTTALFNTHRFDLVERKALGTIFDEQDLGDSGRISPQTKAKIGVTLGADYMILAAVNEWTPDKTKAGGSGRGGAGRRGIAKRVLGGVNAGKSKAEVAMSFRVVDSTSGGLLFSTTERATAGSWGIGLGASSRGLGGLLGYSENAPINYAVHSCVNKGVYKLAMWLKDRSWSGSVMKVAGQKVYINAGSDKGIEAGMTLTALSKGEELINPETGLAVGDATEVIGSLMVTTVKDAYSIATIVQGCQGIQTGDKVEMESSAYGPKAASAPSVAQPSVSAEQATLGDTQ